MKIHEVSVRNFRSFDQFTADLGGRSVITIGENAGGKTALLTAIARALARDLVFTRADFRDPQQPIEVHVTLREFDVSQRGLFGNYIHFGQPPHLVAGVRAVWDSAAESAEIEHGYPEHPGSRSRRDERDGVPLYWLPANRDPSRMLQFGAERNLMASILRGLPIAQSLDQAADDVRRASERLGQDAALVGLLSDARDALSDLIPEVDANAYAIGLTGLTERDLLRQFELHVEHFGPAVAVSRQSSGLSHLSLFVFAMALAAAQPGIILLVDEPELSLHPQAQRALIRFLRKFDAQLILATHSSNLLDRTDPRDVLRLKRGVGGAVDVVSPSTLTDDEAHRLARHTTPHTAEAFFARTVVLVEGESDQFALEVIADRLGRNLDGEGITIVPMGGATLIGTFLALFGPTGFQLSVAGLCDEAEERYFLAGLQRLGIQVQSRQDMEREGFFVCVQDLEDELIRSIGTAVVVRIIDEHGDQAEFQRLQGQPAFQGVSLDEQVRAFVKKHKVEYAPLLTDELDLATIPRPLAELVAHL